MWARSIGPHVYCCLQFNIDDVRAELDDAMYAIFDDMQGGFKFFPSYKGWMGAQSQFTITDKYRHKATIQWGRPTIWLCNEEQWGQDCANSTFDLNWMEANAWMVHLTTPIFKDRASSSRASTESAD